MRILPVFLLSTVISITGCAAAQQNVKPSYKVVAASAETEPRWVTAKAADDATFMFFVGKADGSKDLSRGEDQAEAHAKSLIRTELQQHLRREFETGLGLSAANKREALERALAQGLETVDLGGFVPVARYWERVEVPVDDGTAYAYRVALLVRMPKDRFEATRARAYQAIAKQVGL